MVLVLAVLKTVQTETTGGVGLALPREERERERERERVREWVRMVTHTHVQRFSVLLQCWSEKCRVSPPCANMNLWSSFIVTTETTETQHISAWRWRSTHFILVHCKKAENRERGVTLAMIALLIIHNNNIISNCDNLICPSVVNKSRYNSVLACKNGYHTHSSYEQNARSNTTQRGRKITRRWYCIHKACIKFPLLIPSEHTL